MNKFMAILERAAILAVLSPMTGQAQVSALHRSHFKIDKLSTRKAGAYTYVDGEITSNAKKEAGSVRIRVRWNGESVRRRGARPEEPFPAARPQDFPETRCSQSLPGTQAAPPWVPAVCRKINGDKDNSRVALPSKSCHHRGNAHHALLEETNMISLSPAEYELILHLAHFVGLALAASGVGTILGVLAVTRFQK